MQEILSKLNTDTNNDAWFQNFLSNDANIKRTNHKSVDPRSIFLLRSFKKRSFKTKNVDPNALALGFYLRSWLNIQRIITTTIKSKQDQQDMLNYMKDEMLRKMKNENY